MVGDTSRHQDCEELFVRHEMSIWQSGPIPRSAVVELKRSSTMWQCGVGRTGGVNNPLSAETKPK